MEVFDPKFGLLRLDRATVPLSWAGRYLFRPATAEIDVRVPANRRLDPPSAGHREFATMIEETFGLVLVCALRPLKAALRHYVPGPIPLRNALEEFSLSGMTLPVEPNANPARYEFHFRCGVDDTLTFTLMFVGPPSKSPAVKARVDRACEEAAVESEATLPLKPE